VSHFNNIKRKVSRTNNVQKLSTNAHKPFKHLASTLSHVQVQHNSWLLQFKLSIKSN